MITSRGLGLLAGAFLAWMAGRLLGVPELFALAVAAGALVLFSGLWVPVAEARLSIRRRLSTAQTQLGESADVHIDLRNDGRLASGATLLEDSCSPPARAASNDASTSSRFLVERIPSGQVTTVSYSLAATARGRWRLGPLTVRVRDPFGLVQRVRRYEAGAELLVHPRVEQLRGQPLEGAASSAGAAQRWMMGGSGEFHTIREYRSGDDFRDIHWPSSARSQQLMVRQHEQRQETSATVLLDTRAELYPARGAPVSAFEDAVSAAASVMVHLRSLGYETRLAAGGATGRAAKGPAGDLGDLRRLAEVLPRPGDDLSIALRAARQAGGVLVAVLAPAAGPADPVVAGLTNTRRFSCTIALVSGVDSGAAAVAALRRSGWTAFGLADGVRAAWAGAVGARTQGVRT